MPTEQADRIAGLVEELRSKDHTPPVDPKAVYRTRPVALYERAADALTALRARVGELEGIARLSAAQFRFYELQHRAKHTPEADAKADTNRDLAARIEALLTPPAPHSDGAGS